MNPNDFPATHLSYGGGPPGGGGIGGESISMNQYGMVPPPSLSEQQHHHPNCTSSSSGVNVMRSPSPLMGLGSPGSLQRNPHHSHEYSSPNMQFQSGHDGGGGSCSGTLKRGMLHHHAMSIPDCVQPVPNAVYNPDFNNVNNQFDITNGGGGGHSANPTGSIRLFMNQASGKLNGKLSFYRIILFLIASMKS
jgi:hypothetical protein